MEMYRGIANWAMGVPRTTSIRGTLCVSLDRRVSVETGHTVMAWISGTGVYALVAPYDSGRHSTFPDRTPDDVAGLDSREFDLNLEVPYECVALHPEVSIGVCVLADWGIKEIANRTRTIVGTATIHLVVAVAAAQAGLVAFARMMRLDSRAPPRAACAFLPGGGGRQEGMGGIAAALTTHVRTATSQAQRACREWVIANMRRMDSLAHLDDASAYLKTGRWDIHLGVLPPELYFAPRYPVGPGSLFGEKAFSRALERARFFTGDVSPEEVVRWCSAALTGDPGAALCAATLLGRMLSAFAICMAYTPDVLLHPADVGTELEAAAIADPEAGILVSKVGGMHNIYTEYVEQYTPPAQTMTGDCEETANLSLAACLLFQHHGLGFHSAELKALAALARMYVFSATACLVPLSASSAGSKEERERGGGVAGDPMEVVIEQTAHMTCMGISRREYFAALRGSDALTALPRGLPTIIVEGSGLTHPLIAPHRSYRGCASAARMAGSAVICDGAHSEWVGHAMDRLSAAGIKSKLTLCEFSMDDGVAYYNTFVHGFSWPVEGLPPDPPKRVAFCTDGVIGAPWQTLVDPAGRGLRLMAAPELPPEVLAAARLLEPHLPPPLAEYCFPCREGNPVWVPPGLSAKLPNLGTTDERTPPDPRSRSPEHIVLSVGLCDLPISPQDIEVLLKRIIRAVDPGLRGAFSTIVNSVGPDRGEFLIRIVSS